MEYMVNAFKRETFRNCHLRQPSLIITEILAKDSADNRHLKVKSIIEKNFFKKISTFCLYFPDVLTKETTR